MRVLSLVALLAVGSQLMAQSNYFEIHGDPSCTYWTSRGSLGVDPGEILLQIPASHFSGVCQDASGTATVLTELRLLVQDQNTATQEPYYMVLRADASGAPATGTPLLRVGPFVQPNIGNVIAAWDMIHTITASTAVPSCATFYVGAETVAAPGWPQTDGLSVHMCSFYLLNNASFEDNPAAPPDPVPSLGWNFNYNTNSVSQPGAARSVRFKLGSRAPTLHMGNVDPTMVGPSCLVGLGKRSWGAGGMFPASNGDGLGTRDDGLSARVIDLANRGGVFQLFMSDSQSCPGLQIGSLFTGTLFLNFANLIPVGSGVISAANGEGIIPVIPPGVVLHRSMRGRLLPFQAITVGPTFTLPGNLTNMAGSTFL